MSSKLLKIAVILTLSLTLLFVMTAPSMASAKVIHSVTGNFRSVSGWTTNNSTWYGYGYYWGRCANGKTLLPPGKKYKKMWQKHPNHYVFYGVADRTLKLGTWVQLKYAGATIVVPVVDRGPTEVSLRFDLTGATKIFFDYHARRHFDGVNLVTWRLVKKVK